MRKAKPLTKPVTQDIYRLPGHHTLRDAAEVFAMDHFKRPRHVRDFAVHGDWATFSVTDGTRSYTVEWRAGSVYIGVVGDAQ